MKKDNFHVKSIFALALISPMAFSAGVEKGTIEVGGSISGDLYSTSYSADGEEYRENSYLALSSRAIYYFTDSVGVGINGSYDSAGYEWSTGDVASNKSFSVGPMIAYSYAMNEKVSLKLYGRIFIGEYESEDNGVVDYSTTSTGYSLNAGLAVYQNDFVSIDPHLWFREVFVDGDADYDSTTFGIGFSVSFYKNP